jgi:hypothetical protein
VICQNLAAGSFKGVAASGALLILMMFVFVSLAILAMKKRLLK